MRESWPLQQASNYEFGVVAPTQQRRAVDPALCSSFNIPLMNGQLHSQRPPQQAAYSKLGVVDPTQPDGAADPAHKYKLITSH